MVVFDANLFPQVEAMRQIQRVTLKTTQLLKTLNIPLSTPDPLLVPEPSQATPLNLSIEEEFLSPILKLAPSESLRDAIRNCFMDRFAEMQLKYTTNYRQTCTFLLQTAPSDSQNRGLQEAYQNLYRSQCHALVQRQLPYVMKEVVELKRSGLRQVTTKVEFNHEYTPVLESYFTYNAYPSLSDRLLLARKSTMTPRQIEVWFQNHRNRAKKEGATLRRVPPSATPAFSLGKCVPHIQLINPSRSRSATVDTVSSDDDSLSQHCGDIVVADHRLPHTFPTPYSTISRSGAFPRDHQIFKLALQHWPRLPAKHEPQRSSTSVGDVAKLFARMSIRDRTNPSRGSKSVIKQRKCASPLLFAPFGAPHPAALNPNYVSRFSTTQTPSSCSWQQPSLKARKLLPLRTNVSYPSWAVSDTPRRKAPHSSRRLPSSPPNTYSFDASPRISSTSSASSSSSSCSIFSIGSRSSSTSSLSSQATVELSCTTPGSPVVSIDNEMAPTLIDILHEPNSSSNLQSSSSISQNELSQDWNFSAFVSMDVPGFSFFES